MSGVEVEEFKEMVRAEFGPGLENATPANVREFLDRFHLRCHGVETRRRSPNDADDAPARFVLDDCPGTWEEIQREFFARVLDLPRDQALIMLWTFALELSFATIRDHYAERLAALFGDDATAV